MDANTPDCCGLLLKQPVDVQRAGGDGSNRNDPKEENRAL